MSKNNQHRIIAGKNNRHCITMKNVPTLKSNWNQLDDDDDDDDNDDDDDDFA